MLKRFKIYGPIPIITKVTEEDIHENYLRIKMDINELFANERNKINDKITEPNIADKLPTDEQSSFVSF